MDDNLPDLSDPEALSEEALSAVGGLITTWAGIEGLLSTQVARLAATSDPEAPFVFNHYIFTQTAFISLGTSAKAAITQIGNLAHSRRDELKKHSDALMLLKQKRDAVAHNTSRLASLETVKLLCFGASRVRRGTDKYYSLSELRRWTAEMKEHSQAIDTIVSDLTRWDWPRIHADRKQWLERLDRMGG